MPGALVRYRPSTKDFVVQNHGIIETPDATVPLEILGPASLASLEAAWARFAETQFGVTRMHLSLAPAAECNEYSPVEPVVLEYWKAYRPGGDGALVRAHLETVVEQYHDAFPADGTIETLIAPILARGNATAEIDGFEPDGGGWALFIRIQFHGRGRTVQEAFDVGSEVNALIEAARDGRVVRDTVPALLRGGHARALLGQPEAPWLEAKRTPYPLASEPEKLELAKDVAAMANSPGGGLIVLGLATKAGPDGDEVNKLHPVRLPDVSLSTYRRTISRFVYPLPEGLAIEKIRVGTDEGYVVIDVPGQPEELKPFLVTHALVGERVSGSHVSVVQRHGQDNVPASPAAIHGLLLAGRVALSAAAPAGSSPGDGPAREEADES